jgi:hypothetical protein
MILGSAFNVGDAFNGVGDAFDALFFWILWCFVLCAYNLAQPKYSSCLKNV